MAIIIRPEAISDLQSAVDYYEHQKHGLGNELLDELFSYLKLAEHFPKAFPLSINKKRKLVLHRFPFIVYYFTRKKDIVVIAILHNKRKQEN